MTFRARHPVFYDGGKPGMEMLAPEVCSSSIFSAMPLGRVYNEIFSNSK